jgi:hypothetical protein
VERRSAQIKRDWVKVPEFESKLVKLAVHLHGRSLDYLNPSWHRAELKDWPRF